MKTATRALLSFSIVIQGCFTISPISREEGAPADSKVFFYLRDGSFIESYADHHPRVEGGYQVSGKISRKGSSPWKFEAFVPDSDIDRLGVDEINIPLTVLGAGVAAFAVTGLVLVVGE